MLVYSISSRSSFDRLEVFRQSMLRVKGEAPTFILVGNKADKSAEREVLKEEGARYARELGCEFMETSARTAYNVDKLFSTLIRTLRNNRDGGELGGGVGVVSPVNANGVLDPRAGLTGVPGGGPHPHSEPFATTPGGKKKKSNRDRGKCIIV